MKYLFTPEIQNNKKTGLALLHFSIAACTGTENCLSQNERWSSSRAAKYFTVHSLAEQATTQAKTHKMSHDHNTWPLFHSVASEVYGNVTQTYLMMTLQLKCIIHCHHVSSSSCSL